MIDVTVIIVVRNEENYILDCIQSIEKQFETSHNWELIIVDGLSSDKTKEIAEEYLKKQSYNSTVVDNPKKTLAPGWNIGIKKARGEFVVRPDAHSTLYENYVNNGIDFLRKNPEITAVGGVLETKARGFWGSIIKIALSSKVGVGNSSFRTGVESGIADTAVYAVYRKSIFEKVGYFNEKLVRHQDNDMHKRIKDIGGKFYLYTPMIADYYCRDSYDKLVKQMYNIGRYLPDVMFNGSLSIRHLIPFLFVMSLITGMLFSFFIHPVFGKVTLLVLALYFSIIIVECIYRTIINRKIVLLLNIGIIPSIHFAYGTGTLVGLIKKIKI